MDVGNQLKAIRTMKGISQRELAKLSGVTNSMISQIEKNQVNPSVGSLKKILDAMSVSMGEFFTVDVENKEQIFYSADELVDLGDGAIQMLLVGSKRAKRKLSVMRETYPPGADTGTDFMKHDGEEGGIVLRGEIEIIIGNQTRVLKPGDSYYFDTRTPHRFRNKGKVECELISAATPATF
ncbi:transcriptional regulator, XRE family with cupin sensor [Vibrio xiamenensis]|uniref:Transcriptional regulator, XRE family with cupin sensor n=1 Tax=Vibrio xiamenensis TaxID=861298 RepID=A0A1G7XXJ2_9VIBR|nr:cupin domain-containing protein [Vibrio xiamenensis]SDG77094.1 transcriptional regulator, XRE family with cupin sensor [Vibrio xiamenensis]SDG88450.1 transcriptional regulator, XRE family with cupin sensor [Vibrio xiamenensis]